jgi:hypothetical protein
MNKLITYIQMLQRIIAQQTFRRISHNERLPSYVSKRKVKHSLGGLLRQLNITNQPSTDLSFSQRWNTKTIHCFRPVSFFELIDEDILGWKKYTENSWRIGVLDRLNGDQVQVNYLMLCTSVSPIRLSTPLLVKNGDFWTFFLKFKPFWVSKS